MSVDYFKNQFLPVSRGRKKTDFYEGGNIAAFLLCPKNEFYCVFLNDEIDNLHNSNNVIRGRQVICEDKFTEYKSSLNDLYSTNRLVIDISYELNRLSKIRPNNIPSYTLGSKLFRVLTSSYDMIAVRSEKDGEIFYGCRGLILDKYLIPVYFTTTELHIYSETNNTALSSINCKKLKVHVDNRVYTSTNPLFKFLKNTIVPKAQEANVDFYYSVDRRVRVVIEDTTDYIVSKHKEFNDRIEDYEEVLESIDNALDGMFQPYI